VLKSLLDLHVQVVPVHHVLSDLVDWQLNEHTGDLWCLVVTNDHLDELVDAATDLGLQVGVVWVEGWDVLVRGVQVSLLDWHAVWVLLHAHHLVGVWHHWHAWSLRHLLLLLLLLWHWLLLLLLLLLLNHSLLWWHVHLLLLSHVRVHLLLLLAHVGVTLVHVLTHAALVAAHVILSWAPVVLASSSLVSSDVTLELLVGLLVDLDDTEELLEHLSQVRLRGQVVPLETSAQLGLVLLPVSLVTGLLHLELSDLLDLIVVDHEHLASEVVVLQVLLGLGSIGWLLVADESESILGGSTLLKSDVFDLTILLEQVHQVLLGVLVGEVLHVEVASLLRSLVSNGVTDLFDVALRLLQGVLDAELDAWSDLAIIELIDGLLGALRTVLLVLAGWVIVADEGELAELVLLDEK